MAKKLCGPRVWVELRYYVGQIKQADNDKLYAEQRAFIARQKSRDTRISFHMGRMERRVASDGAARELAAYVATHSTTLDAPTQTDLSAIVSQHANVVIHVEKAVDVMLAVDLVVLAEQGAYDTAYVLSADGDFTPAAAYVRSKGKKMFAASASSGAELAKAVDSFIRLRPDWVNDCYI